MDAKTPRISPTALAEIEAALRDYSREVLRAGLGEFATNMYIDKADYFVRWSRGFETLARGCFDLRTEKPSRSVGTTRRSIRSSRRC